MRDNYYVNEVQEGNRKRDVNQGGAGNHTRPGNDRRVTTRLQECAWLGTT